MEFEKEEFTNMNRYALLKDVIVQADCPINKRSSDRVVLPSGEEISIHGETFDLFDASVRYWATGNGWVLKITDNDLPYFKKI